MEKINILDPDAIVIFQADHGFLSSLDIDQTEKERDQLKAKIFNAVKAPEICFDNYGLPKTNVNTIRFALNCAYGSKFQYRKDVHYNSYYEDSPEYGTVVEKIIYE